MQFVAKLEFFHVCYFNQLGPQRLIELRILRNQLGAVFRVFALAVNFNIQASWIIEEYLSESAFQRLNCSSTVRTNFPVACIEAVVFIFYLSPVARGFFHKTSVLLKKLVHYGISCCFEFFLSWTPILSLF